MENQPTHYLYLDANKRPDDLYPAAIALAILTGRVALYCPTVQFVQDQNLSKKLGPVLGWLIDMGAIMPMGSQEQLDEFWPDPTRSAPETFIEVDPTYHREWAVEKALSINPEYIRVPKKDFAPTTIATAMRRIKSEDERQGFVYTIATDAAVCNQTLYLAGTKREVVCSPALPTSWMKGIIPALENAVLTTDTGRRFQFQLLESQSSQVVANIRQRAIEFAADCTPETLGQLRKEYAAYESELELSLISSDAEMDEKVLQTRLNLENESRRLTHVQKQYRRFVEFVSPIKNGAGIIKDPTGLMPNAEQLATAGISTGLHAVELFYQIRYRKAVNKHRWLYRLLGIM